MLARSLHPDEIDACLALWKAIYPDISGDYFLKYFDDPAVDTIVCEHRGRLTSVVQVLRRVVETPTGRAGMAGIANVGTHPEHRRKGHATLCLRETLQRIEEDGSLQLSVLVTNVPTLYEPLGWTRWKQRLWEGGNPFRGQTRAGSGARPANDADLPRIAAWHEAHNRNRPLAVVRSEEYWRRWVEWTPADKLVTEHGYAHVIDTEGIRIVVARSEGFPWEEALGDAERIRLCLPISEAEVRAVLAAPVCQRWGGLMVRPLKGRSLCDMDHAHFYDGDFF